MADLFAFYNKKKLPCRVCGKDFEGIEKPLTFHQRRIHAECFKCRKCSFDFATPNPEFHALELHEFPYCPTCYCDETGEAICRACHKLIDNNEKFVAPQKMPNKKYHTRCFVCGECSQPLKEAYSTKAGKPHCLSCYDPTSNITQPTNSAIDVNRSKEVRKPKPVATSTQSDPTARPTCEVIQNAPEPEPEPSSTKIENKEPVIKKPTTEEEQKAKKAFEKAETERLMKYVSGRR